LVRWENNTFGKAGQFYPLLYFAPAPVIGVSLFLFGYSFSSDLQLWERLVVAGFGIFFLIYFFKVVEAIIITRSTIRQIVNDDNIFHIKTFDGKTFEVNRFSKVMEDDDFFAKKNIRFLFPDDTKNMIVRCNSKDYYISGSIEGIEM